MTGMAKLKHLQEALTQEHDQKNAPVGTSQTHRILKLLQEKGSVTNIELNSICYRYSARLHELRREGHVVLTVPESKGKYRYFYRGQVERETA